MSDVFGVIGGDSPIKEDIRARWLAFVEDENERAFSSVRSASLSCHCIRGVSSVVICPIGIKLNMLLRVPGGTLPALYLWIN